MENLLIENDLQEQRQGFKVEDLEGANWAFRKLRALEEKEKQIKVLAEQELSRISSWKEEQLKSFGADKQYFEGIITQYYAEQKELDPKFKLTTPYGKVSSRKSKKWVYEDEEKLKEFVKENDIPVLRVKEEVDKTALKKIFKDGVNEETGEILPFVRVEESESITVKVE